MCLWDGFKNQFAKQHKITPIIVSLDPSKVILIPVWVNFDQQRSLALSLDSAAAAVCSLHYRNNPNRQTGDPVHAAAAAADRKITTQILPVKRPSGNSCC